MATGLKQIFQFSSLRLKRVKQDIHKSLGGLKLKFTLDNNNTAGCVSDPRSAL